MPSPWLCTRSGTKFYPLRPRAEDVHLEDIAHGLAHTFRFGGQSPMPYTVAQHSIEVSRTLRPRTGSQKEEEDKYLTLWGLLHDAAEAYLWDIQQPVKRMLKWKTGQRTLRFEQIENKIMAAVAERFSLPWPLEPKLNNLLKDADFLQLRRERRDLFGPEQPVWRDINTILDLPPIAVPRLSTVEARTAFLEEFKRIAIR